MFMLLHYYSIHTPHLDDVFRLRQGAVFELNSTLFIVQEELESHSSPVVCRCVGGYRSSRHLSASETKIRSLAGERARHNNMAETRVRKQTKGQP